jgi:hypothetical protein
MENSYLQTQKSLHSNEKNILKIIEWAHRNKVLVENLTVEMIIEANHAYLRDSLHS